jgi:hypothetical protein
VLSVDDDHLDAEEDLPTASDISTLVASPNGTKPQTKPSVDELYEIVPDPQAELSLKVFCFFEDLHILQGEVRKAWNAFKAGNLTLVAATIVTTAAIELVGRAEKELVASYPRDFKVSRSYQDLAQIIFYSESLRQGIDANAHMASTDDLEITPFKEFMYLPVGRTLMRISQQQSMFDKAGWPAPVMRMRFNYVGKPELLDTPQMEKIQKEDEMLCQLILEHTLLELMKETEAKRNKHTSTSDLHANLLPAFDDIFTDTMRPV